MGEAEFNMLLHAVDAALNAAPEERALAHEADFIVVPVAANDNEAPWPHFPFPEGWTATN